MYHISMIAIHVAFCPSVTNVSYRAYHACAVVSLWTHHRWCMPVKPTPGGFCVKFGESIPSSLASTFLLCYALVLVQTQPTPVQIASGTVFCRIFATLYLTSELLSVTSLNLERGYLPRLLCNHKIVFQINVMIIMTYNILILIFCS